MERLMEKLNIMKERLFDLEDEEIIEPLTEEYRNLLRESFCENYGLPEEMIDLYLSYSDGFKIEWVADDADDIRGKINFLEMEKILGNWKGIIYFDEDEKNKNSICNYHPFDYITEDASCGIYINPEDNKAINQIYYHYAGETEIHGLDLNFAGYFEMMTYAKGFFYWPKVLIDIQNGNESYETKRFKEKMPELFDEFNWDDFAARYESLKLNPLTPSHKGRGD